MHLKHKVWICPKELAELLPCTPAQGWSAGTCTGQRTKSSVAAVFGHGDSWETCLMMAFKEDEKAALFLFRQDLTMQSSNLYRSCHSLPHARIMGQLHLKIHISKPWDHTLIIWVENLSKLKWTACCSLQSIFWMQIFSMAATDISFSCLPFIPPFTKLPSKEIHGIQMALNCHHAHVCIWACACIHTDHQIKNPFARCRGTHLWKTPAWST